MASKNTTKKVVAKKATKNVKVAAKSKTEKNTEQVAAFPFPTRKSMKALEKASNGTAKFTERFAVGDLVEHPLHGVGEVSDSLADNRVRVMFHKYECESVGIIAQNSILTLVQPSVPQIEKVSVPEKPESVKFETLPLLAQFGVGEFREFYLKVGNSTAIHLTHSTVNYPERPLKVGKQGKTRFKKAQQVFPVK